MPTHTPVGSYTPVTISSPGVLDTLPDWWGKLLAAGTGTVNPYASVRDAGNSNAIAVGELLPLGYGQIRVAGSELFIQGLGSSTTYGQGVIAWLEGEIESIDAVYGNGGAWNARTDAYATIALNQHRGEAGGETNPGGIFGGAKPTFAGVAYTHFQVTTANYQWRWWTYVPGGYTVDLTQSGGRIQTTWAADIHALKLFDPRTGLTVYSNNPVLEARDLLVRCGRLVDDATFSTAATAAEAAGFTCNIVFAAKTLLTDALANILQTCNGVLIDANGTTGIYLDVVNAGDPVAVLSEEDGDIWDLTYEWLSSRDRITRMAVSFPNSAANWTQDQTPNFDDPGIALGTVPIKPLVVNAPGITTLPAAVILRDYLFNRQAIRFRVSGKMNSKGLGLYEGQKVRLVTLRGVDIEAILEQIPTDAQGFFSFVARPYDSDVWTTTPITQGPPIMAPQPFDFHPSDPPDEIAFPVLIANPASLSFMPPRYMDAGHAATSWAGGYAYLDLGAGNAAKCGKFISTLGVVGPGTWKTPPLGVDFSDDLLTWTAVSGFVSRSWTPGRTAPAGDSIFGPGETAVVSEWNTPASPYRHWRASIAPGVVTLYWGTLADFSFVGVLVETDPEVEFFELHALSDPSVPDHVFLTLPAGASPSAAFPLRLDSIIARIPWTYGGTTPFFLSRVGLVVVTVRKSGARSTGVPLYSDGAVPGVLTMTAAALPTPVAGSLLLAMDAADNVAKISVNGAPFAAFGAGGGGSPGATIPDRVSQTGSPQTVNSGTAADIAGAALSFTPDVTGRHLIVFSFDVTVSAFHAGETFEGQLVVDTTAVGEADFVGEALGARAVVTNSATVDLTAGVAAAIKLTGRVASYASAAFDVSPPHTGFVIVPPPGGPTGLPGADSTVPGPSGVAGASPEAREDHFDGDDATTVFHLTASPAGGIIFVALASAGTQGGVILPKSAWSLSGSDLTMGAPVSRDDLLIVSYHGALTGSMSQLQEDFPGAGGTDFPLAHNPAAIYLVSRGGIVQLQTAFLIVGTTLRMTSPVLSGDTVSISYLWGTPVALVGPASPLPPTKLTTKGGSPTITGACDGSNRTFTTSVSASLATFWEVRADSGIDDDATWSGTTLTTSTGPISSVRLIYWS